MCFLNNRPLRCGVIALATVMLFVCDSRGQDFWVEPTGGFFDVGSNWMDGSAPGASEAAVFDIDAVYDVQWDGITGNVTNQILDIGDGEISFVNLLSGGADFTYTLSERIVVVNLAVLKLNPIGGTNKVHLDVTNDILVDNGRLDGFAGTNISSNLVSAGGFGTGFITLNGTGTEMNVGSMGLLIGVLGNGGLFIEDGAVVNSTGFALIGGTDSIGTAQLSGSGSELNVNGDLDIGNSSGSFGGLTILDSNLVTVGGNLFMAFTNGGGGGLPNLIENNDSDLLVEGSFLMGTAGDSVMLLRENCFVQVGSTFRNGPSGTINASGFGVPQIAAAVVQNQGTITFDGTGTDITGAIQNDGTIESLDTSFNIFFNSLRNNENVMTASSAITRVVGTASGDGIFMGPGLVEFAGNIEPGSGSGILATDSPLQVNGNINLLFGSDLQIEIGGTGFNDFDQLWPDNDINIADGSGLTVHLIGGFLPSVGDSFLIVCPLGSTTGTFDGFPEGATVRSIAGVDLNITYVAGGGNDVVLNAVDAGILFGDVNLDGNVDLLDVQPFVVLLIAGGYQAEADINMDGAFDLLDVQPFVDLLTG